jgi:hypothetical protein
VPIHRSVTKPFALLRQLGLLSGGAALLYGAALGAVAWMPGLLAGSVAGPVALYVALVAMSVACVRGWQALARERAVTRMARAVGELEGTNRLLDFKARMESRLVEAASSAHLEREVNKRERKIQQMAYEGRISEMKQQSNIETMQRELEYYKREHQRLHTENRWLKSSLRQNHIDLAFLKEHVDRYLTKERPTMISRVKSLFTLSSPSPAIVKLARSLVEVTDPAAPEAPSSGFHPAR